MLYFPADAYIGRSLDLYGEFSQAELDLLEPFVVPGAVVLDVGANIGTHTVFFAQRAGEAGRVVAFEPQRTLHHVLCGNAALNGLRNVHAHHTAVGREPGTLRVPALDVTAEQNLGGLSLGDWGDGEPVAVMRIDDLDLPRCELVKIDVEGMECDVLDGATETIRRHRPVLYVENDRAEHSRALLTRLLDLGYRVYWHLPPLFAPDNYFGESENVFGGTVSANVLAVHTSSPHVIRGLRRVASADDTWDE